MSKEKILPIEAGKTKLYPSSFLEIAPEDKFVRTGTLNDGSCFVHALLQAYSIDYRKCDIEEKQNFAKSVREKISKNLSKTEWEELGNGEVSKVVFQGKVMSLFEELYDFINKDAQNAISQLFENEELKKSIPIFKILFSALPLSIFTDNNKGILPKSFQKNQNKSLDVCKDDIVHTSVLFLLKELKVVSESKRDVFVERFSMLLRTILNHAEKTVFTEYRKVLSQPNNHIDQFYIGLISNKFDRDIYFINAETQEPYLIGGDIDYKNRLSNIILWVNNDHYEILGRVVAGTNNIQREFKTDDRVIKKLREKLFKK